MNLAWVAEKSTLYFIIGVVTFNHQAVWPKGLTPVFPYEIQAGLGTFPAPVQL